MNGLGASGGILDGEFRPTRQFGRPRKRSAKSVNGRASLSFQPMPGMADTPHQSGSVAVLSWSVSLPTGACGLGYRWPRCRTYSKGEILGSLACRPAVLPARCS
jgi:hypothetical protein